MGILPPYICLTCRTFSAVCWCHTVPCCQLKSQLYRRSIGNRPMSLHQETGGGNGNVWCMRLGTHASGFGYPQNTPHFWGSKCPINRHFTQLRHKYAKYIKISQFVADFYPQSIFHLAIGQHTLQNAALHGWFRMNNAKLCPSISEQILSSGLTGRLCIVAETAHDLQLRDGGMEGSVARDSRKRWWVKWPWKKHSTHINHLPSGNLT